MATFEEQCDREDCVQGLAVITCDHNTQHIQFIQKILRHFDRTTHESKEYEPKLLDLGFDNNLEAFELKIDNKYYSANIFLFDMKDKHLFNERLADSVNGVIVYFDCNPDLSSNGVESRLPYINQFDNQMKLLVCQTIDDIKRQFIEKWCLDNEFELVELLPQTDVIEDEFDVNGVTRICDAIQAYHWPYSTHKERRQYNPSPNFKNLLEKEVLNNCEDIPKRDDQKADHLSEQFTDRQEMEDFDNFNHLFEKFSEMKVKSSQMNEIQRKDYAQKVTIAFWKAIGGDVDEIEGLDADGKASN